MNTVIRTQLEDKIEYRLNGVLHRDGGPALICNNGTMIWYQNGKRHRTDGPALILSNGLMFDYINGKLIKPIMLPI